MKRKTVAILLAVAMLGQNAGSVRAGEITVGPIADSADVISADQVTEEFYEIEEDGIGTEDMVMTGTVPDGYGLSSGDDALDGGETETEIVLPQDGLIEETDDVNPEITGTEDEAVQLEAQEVFGALSWTLSGGTLTVSGSGAMPTCDYDYDEVDDYYTDGFPWAGSRDSITKVIIGDEVTSISPAAFWNCENLKSVTIGKNVGSIGEQAFFPDTSLSSVTFNACAFEGDEETASGLPQLVIGSSAFDSCETLRSLRLPKKTVSIGESAFDNCIALSQIYLGENLKTIGEMAFSCCAMLAKVEIPSTVSRIDSCAFEACGEDTAEGSLELHFRGDYPVVFAEDAFSEAYVKGFYPGGNATWTETVLSKDYAAAELSWNPEGIDISRCSITVEGAPYAYTGKCVYPDLKVIYTNEAGEARTLEKNTDYIVTSQSYNIGSAFAYVEGKGDFVGKAKVDYQIILMAKLVPELTLTWDSYTYKNGDIGDPLKMTLKVKNEPVGKTLEEMTDRDKEDACLHIGNIDFTIEDTPVAYFSQSGEQYIQRHIVTPSGEDLDIAAGEEKELVTELEILTNPPVIITAPVQKAKVTYTVSGKMGGTEVELTNHKEITFKYEFRYEEPGQDYTEDIDWVTNEGTLSSISYLSNNSNFIYCLNYICSDSSARSQVADFLSDLIFRDWEGRENLVLGTLEQSEAEQLLVDFLAESEDEVEYLANLKECETLAEDLTEGFKQYVLASGSKVLGKEIKDFDAAVYKNIYIELSNSLKAANYSNVQTLNSISGTTDELRDMKKLFASYSKSLYFSQRLLQGIKAVGGTVTILSASADAIQQIKEIGKLQIADKLYCEMLDHLAENCEYAPVRKAASRLSGIIHDHVYDAGVYVLDSFINEAIEEAIELGADYVVKESVGIAANIMKKGASGFALAGIAAKAGFDVGVFVSNWILKTSDQAELKDQMEILYYVGRSLGSWIYGGVIDYRYGDKDAARLVAYGESMLIKARRAGEKTYQKFCEVVKMTDSETYKVSKQISLVIDQIDKWLSGDKSEALSIAGFYCPVDVDVMDSSGKVVLTIRDGVPASGESGNIVYECAKLPDSDDYYKIFAYPKNSGYQFRCRGVGQGTVFGYFSQFGADGLTRCRTFTDIPVEEGTEISVSDPFQSDCYTIVDGEKITQSEYDRTILPPSEGSVLYDASGNVYEITKFGTVNGIRGTATFVRPGNTAAASVTIPDTFSAAGITYRVTAIAARAFFKNKKLKSAVIGANVQTIGNEAFSSCAKLSKVTIGSRVSQIGAKAFFKCTALKKITIPASVTSIGAQAFFGCKKLKTITIQTTSLTNSSVGAKAFKKTPAKAKVKVPKAVLKSYQKLLKKKGLSKKARVKK